MEDQSSESTLNYFADGICNQCGSDKVSETVSCMLCCKPFHMTNCGDEEDKFYLMPSTFSQFEKAINKVGKFAKRPGCFKFVCDPCMTGYEVKIACKTNDNLQILDSKVNNLARDMGEIKQLLSKQAELNANPTTRPAPLQNSLPTSGNVWSNAVEVNRIKSLLVVDKAADFDNLDMDSSVFKSGVQIHSKTIDKKGNTVIVCNSQKSKDQLKQQILKNGVSNGQISEPKPRYPAISVVGLCKELNKEELYEQIMNQNHIINEVCTANNEAVFDIIAVKPLRNNSTVFQAFVRVSDDVRHAIKQQRDKIFFGWEKLSVYDQLFIKRCNKCQGYNHYHRECKNTVSCGLCAAHDHEYINCPHKDKSVNDKAAFYCCINCKNAGESDVSHPAYSSLCKLYKMEQEALKKSLAQSSKNY